MEGGPCGPDQSGILEGETEGEPCRDWPIRDFSHDAWHYCVWALCLGASTSPLGFAVLASLGF